MEKGFLMEDRRELLLHATVVNTIYAKSYDREGKRQKGGKWGKRVRIDARGLVGEGTGRDGGGQEEHGDEGEGKDEEGEVDGSGAMGGAQGWGDVVWAEDVVVGRIVVCEMGAKKVVVEGSEDEVYTEVGGVKVGGLG